jgi:SPP1 family predicted phage head-tail adaptor
MYFTDEITLIAYDEHQDDIGNWVKTPVETPAFCSVSSITRAEFFDAGRNGMKPDCVVTMRKCDYDGQTEVELNGKRLHVYRTYSQIARAQHQAAGNPDMIELHLEETANV